MWKSILIISIIALVSGCATTQQSAKLSVNQIIWEPQTEFEHKIHEHLFADFMQIVEEIQEPTSTSESRNNSRPSSNIRFMKNGIKLVPDEKNPDMFYIQLILHYYRYILNTIKSTYNIRAEDVITRNLFFLSKVISKHPNLFKEDKIIGFKIIFVWKAQNFLHPTTPTEERVTVLIPKDTLRDFANMKISIKELAKQSTFISPFGKIELDLGFTLNY